MSANAVYDISKLSELVSGMLGALNGRGGIPGDGALLIRTETGQLAGRIGDAVGPKTQSAANKKIDRDLKQQLTILPRFSIFDRDEQRESPAYSDFTWLTAGPDFLLGINDEDNQTDATGAAAYQMLRAGQKTTPRGDAYERIGIRGRQAILRLNRVKVSVTAFNFVRNKIRGVTGEMRGAFYAVAKYYIPSKRIPAWIQAKIDQAVANGKSEHRDSGTASGMESFAEFTVRAKGVVNNPRLAIKIQGAIDKSRFILAGKLKKLVQGYQYQWSTGAVYWPAVEQSLTE